MLVVKQFKGKLICIQYYTTLHYTTLHYTST